MKNKKTEKELVEVDKKLKHILESEERFEYISYFYDRKEEQMPEKFKVIDLLQVVLFQRLSNDKPLRY